MNRLRRLSAAVALLLCFATPVASAAHGGQSAKPGSPAGTTTGIAAPAPDGFPIDKDIPLCC
ncbi:hypothetical protein ACFYZB_38590 [Streptomyces sp. NPDC001852]|uniref:hypothetical protein n=1 Tax=Streptomyces sp. NPDC001852 TaxID=3364619 RepID=UPI0036B5A62C